MIRLADFGKMRVGSFWHNQRPGVMRTSTAMRGLFPVSAEVSKNALWRAFFVPVIWA
jgi:hypothetical protein